VKLYSVERGRQKIVGSSLSNDGGMKENKRRHPIRKFILVNRQNCVIDVDAIGIESYGVAKRVVACSIRFVELAKRQETARCRHETSSWNVNAERSSAVSEVKSISRTTAANSPFPLRLSLSSKSFIVARWNDERDSIRESLARRITNGITETIGPTAEVFSRAERRNDPIGDYRTSCFLHYHLMGRKIARLALRARRFLGDISCTRRSSLVETRARLIDLSTAKTYSIYRIHFDSRNN